MGENVNLGGMGYKISSLVDKHESLGRMYFKPMVEVEIKGELLSI